MKKCEMNKDMNLLDMSINALKNISKKYLKKPLKNFLLIVNIKFFKNILKDFSRENLNKVLIFFRGIFFNFG